MAGQLSQMEKEIKHFMDQKRAIIQSLKNVHCPVNKFTEWYQYIVNLKNPTIELNQTTNSIKLNIKPLCTCTFATVCKATNGTLTHIAIDVVKHSDMEKLDELIEMHKWNLITCDGSVDFTSLPSSLEFFHIFVWPSFRQC